MYHHEKLPSALERYENEAKRILGVLDGALEGKRWLVGDKMTFADLAFVNWNSMLNTFLRLPDDQNVLKGFPNVNAWHESMIKRKSFQRCMELRTKLVND